MYILHVAKKDIIEHCNCVDVEDSIFQGNEQEVDELCRRPNQPVGDVNRPKLLSQEIVSLANGLSSQEEYRVEVVSDEYWTNYQLKSEKNRYQLQNRINYG